MRTVYLGTSEFAATVLDRLAATAAPAQRSWSPAPTARAAAGASSPPPPVAETRRAARHRAAPAGGRERRGRRASAIAGAEPEAVAICAYGALIKEPLLSEHEMLNVHPSLLPRWRGAAPIERAIEAGDEETGVTIMRPTAELDAGPVVPPARGARSAPTTTTASLATRLAALGGELLVEALDLRPPFREQPETGVTYAEKIEAEDRLLDPSRCADELERRVRALTPHIGAYVELPWDERLGVTPRGARSRGRRGPGRRLTEQRRPAPLRRRQRRARAAGGTSGRQAPDGRRSLDSRLRRTTGRVSR